MGKRRKVGQVINGLFKKVFYSCCRGKSVYIANKVLLANNADLEIAPSAELYIGSLTTIERYGLVAVRRNAKISIGERVYLNRNCIVVAHESIIIENGVTVGPNCCIYDHDHDIKCTGKYITSSIHIKENTWIGAGCIILKGVTIGKDCIIAAGTIVTKDVPDNTVLCNRLEYRSKTI